MCAVIQPRTQDMIDMTPIDPGTYPATVTKAEPGTGKAKGTPLLVVDFAVNVPDRSEPCPRTSYMPTEGKGTWGFDQFLRAVNMEEIADQLKEGQDVPIDTDVFVGQELQVVIDHQEYQGTMRDTITTYLKA